MASRPVIGVLSPLLAGEYFGAVIAAIGDQAIANGARLIAVQTLDGRVGESDSSETDFSSQVGWDHLSGLIVVINAVSDEYLHSVMAAGMPLVMISRDVPGVNVPIVGPDNRAGVRDAVTHLIEHGHTRIAFAGDIGQPDIRERWESYCDTLRANGIEPDPALFYGTVDNLEKGGEGAGLAMLEAGLPSTAMMAATDYNAIGIMRALTASGRSLPRDQAIVGFDNLSTGAHLAPPLTTVSQHFDQIGRAAAKLLFDLIAGRPVSADMHTVGTSMVVRGSCGCDKSALAQSPATEQGAAARLLRGLHTSYVHLGGDVTSVDAAAIAASGSDIISRFRAAAQGSQEVDVESLGRAAEQIFAITADREVFVELLRSAQALARELAVSAGGDGAAATVRLDACMLELTLAAVSSQLVAQYSTNRQLRTSLRGEYDIGLDLLRRDEMHPRELGWLARTQVRAGCIGLRVGSESGWAQTVAVAGVYNAHQPTSELIGAVVPERQFPPEQILEMVDETDDVIFVLPVKTKARDWGFLAVVGPVEYSKDAGRETYFQWASLLSVALDHEEVLQSLRRQREDLASAYNRERGLVESIRVSEERYALAARAANDGLWDWDLQSGEIFYSGRWKEMLGYDDAAIAALPAEWLDRVHDDDLPGLKEAMHPAAGGEITSFEHEHRVRSHTGSFRWMLCRALAVPGPGWPTTRLVGSLTDITERKELEDRLRQGALYDALTGLPNRTLFLDRLDRAIAHSKRRRDYNFVVLFLDLDGFKVVNDSLGHLAGDHLLMQVAARITAQLRDADTAARFGGDEFAILLNDVTDMGAVPTIVDRLQAALAMPYELDQQVIVVSASIGIATSTTGYDLPEDVLRDSDIAMYRAKANERGTYATFDISMHEGAVRRMRIESELRSAIEKDQFELHYQPIVRLDTHRIDALEALVRWRHPTRGLLLPGDFLPVAEEAGLIVPVGRLIVENVCRQLATWALDGVSLHGARVSVNVSNHEFWHPNFQAHLVASLEAYALQPSSLNLEITEGVIMHNPEVAQTILQDLRRMGFQLHIDDFGTGYSSLDALHRFPVEALKIDRSFVSRLESDRKSRELVRTIVMMGRNLDMDVIAEGIENAAQEDILRDLGCVFGQGYLFARPLAVAAASALLAGTQSVAAGTVLLPSVSRTGAPPS